AVLPPPVPAPATTAVAAPVAAGPAPATTSTTLADTPAIATDIALPAAALAHDDSDTPEPSPFSNLLQGLSAAADVRGTAAGSAPFAGAPTATPDLASDGFDEAIGARVSWLADQKIGHAHIRITPHEMGQVDVKLQLDGERVHATFTSAHAEVRHALENSLPRLREMLGEQGLQLAHADVGQQSSSQEQKDGGTPATAAVGEDAGGVAGKTDVGVTTRLLHRRGLLDAYA
ncbi:flagellar hook-length control protein FliK, partial [Stenotrophomonas sp. YIM B06876]|uniref:flagellar hook-length control protein FliK n=1 Tax=Stenotrophomonas sp. YIM B06876 TaxID=3060211 RepID=UPI0027393012